jgi:hypothetical protein
MFLDLDESTSLDWSVGVTYASGRSKILDKNLCMRSDLYGQMMPYLYSRMASTRDQ